MGGLDRELGLDSSGRDPSRERELRDCVLPTQERILRGRATQRIRDTELLQYTGLALELSDLYAAGFDVQHLRDTLAVLGTPRYAFGFLSAPQRAHDVERLARQVPAGIVN